MKEFKYTFSNVKKYGYIYCVSFNSLYLLIYKYKVLNKKVISYRIQEKFGGRKETYISFNIKLIEYCGNSYETNNLNKIVCDGKKNIEERNHILWFAEKEEYLKYLDTLKNIMLKNLNNIELLKNK